MNTKQKEDNTKNVKNMKNDKARKRNFTFDIIGDIAILPRDFGLNNKDEQMVISKIISLYRTRIKSIALKTEKISGMYRASVLETIWGEQRTHTVAKENGCYFELDLQKVFFCPRLSYERLRIAKQIKKDENVLVMFAGVGPYAIIASKYSNAKNIVAIEINPDAFLFMQKNIEKNKCNNIEPILADVRDALLEFRFENWADRIIMPHPFSDTNFLALAIRALKPNGIIHYYSFENRHAGVEKIFEDAKKQACNLADLVLLKSKKVRPICPNVYHYVLDMQVFHCACKPRKHFSQIP